MKKIESLSIQESAYIETLENGLTIIIIPKKKTKKKYVTWGTHFGSIDNHFILPKTEEEIKVPDGVAHFLEHKMFEQENGINSLDVLMALGVDANAYTTSDHTAYLFETTDHFYEALDELMDYVQHPYFTEENVEKEKGIIAQEIRMYQDDPTWQLYMNTLDCLYQNNSIKIDIAGSVESIQKINKDVLYNCYQTFYHPSNMAMVLCGDFEPEEIIEEIKKRLVSREQQGKIKRMYPQEKEEIHKKEKETQMEVSQPIFMIGYKDRPGEDMVRRHIAVQIIVNLLMGKSSSFYQNMYQEGILLSPLDYDYEFSPYYAHVLISGQTKEPEKIKQAIEEIVTKGWEEQKEEDFNRIKRKLYGDYVAEYNSVADIARMFLQDFFKGIHSFDYIEQFQSVTFEYVKKVFLEIFDEKNKVMSIVKSKTENSKKVEK